MFSSAWFYSALLILFLAAVLREPGMAAVAVLLLLTASLSWLWNRFCLSQVSYERVFSEQRVFPGEHVVLTVRVANRKILPLAWLETVDEFPSRLPLLKGKVMQSANPLVASLSHAVSLRWYERINWRYEFAAAARGYFPFGPVSIRSGDPFGFFQTGGKLPNVDYLIVYPRVVDLDHLGLPFKQPFGEVRSRERIFEDVSRSIGIRDWRQGDERRRIHWKATARRQGLQVRVYEPTSTLSVAIFLNVATLPATWEGSDPELLEAAITAAASLANFALEGRCPVGLYANTSLPNSDQSIRIAPGRSPAQLTTILEALAKVTAFPTVPLEDLLTAECGRLPWGVTLVIVSAVLPESLLATLVRLRDAGHRLTLAPIGVDAPADGLNGINVLRVAERKQDRAASMSRSATASQA
jgi:uncharacterized protein (DUF58 family)